MPLTEDEVKEVWQREADVFDKVFKFLYAEDKYFSAREIAEKLGFSKKEVQHVLGLMNFEFSPTFDSHYLYCVRKDGEEYYTIVKQSK